MTNHNIPWWRNRHKWPFAVFLAIGGYVLWTGHRAHVIEFLPWLLVLGCISMHLFMHHGHSNGDDRDHNATHNDHTDPDDDKEPP